MLRDLASTFTFHQRSGFLMSRSAAWWHPVEALSQTRFKGEPSRWPISLFNAGSWCRGLPLFSSTLEQHTQSGGSSPYCRHHEAGKIWLTLDIGGAINEARDGKYVESLFQGKSCWFWRSLSGVLLTSMSCPCGGPFCAVLQIFDWLEVTMRVSKNHTADCVFMNPWFGFKNTYRTATCNIL